MPVFDSLFLENKLEDRLSRSFNTDIDSATDEQLYKALALMTRESLAERHRRFTAKSYGEGRKRVCYLCVEFLIGRSLRNNLSNLNVEKQTRELLERHGMSLDNIYEQEPDAGLGNGGLGRLAACYLDALASCGYPADGYSILYEYGIFKQAVIDGWQQEQADNWLPGGSVWLEEHPTEAVEVRFDGEIDEQWLQSYHHVNYKKYNSVMAMPYDMYISGYGSPAVSRLRLWKAVAPGIDMERFNRGDYLGAIKQNSSAELISKVLYPNDEHLEGKILRLRQQYFLCAASIADMVHRHIDQYGTLENLPEKIAVHINDTHPTLAIPELMRIMIDECGYDWDKAFDIVCRTFAFTNHTILSEALECWNVDMFSSVLPRIYSILVEMDRRLCEQLRARYGNDTGKIEWMRIISGGSVHMANIDVAVCHSVNGVSKLHSEILKESLFSDYYDFEPQKFTNVTNGIAYRRWLLQGNELLSDYLSGLIGDGFKKDAAALKKLEKYRDDAAVLAALADIKNQNKRRLADYIKKTGEIAVDPDSIFDVQAKRLHEYKRQHLNALHILRQYLDIKNDPKADIVPRTYIFGGKAAPGYYMAKQMIRLVCAVRDLLAADADVAGRLRVVFLEDYRVSLSEILMPAAEISEQISLAGKEASGTGNMKFMLNGAITLGTLDGANVEIRERVGAENFVLFGMTKKEVLSRAAAGYDPRAVLKDNARLAEVMELVKKGFAGGSYDDIYNNLSLSDPYMVLADFDAYCKAQGEIDEIYRDKQCFGRMSLMNIANAGIFSADRSVREYAENIWGLGESR